MGSVLRNTDYSSRLVVILDGTEIENFQCAETFGHKVNFSKVVSNSYGRGLPGCSNLLIRESETPFLVLLHSGTYVGPRWLSLLIGALKSDNSYGITGPSTNLAWNEQQVNDQPSGTPLAIDAYAKQLGAKYNGIFHYLDVTHSLCEFCYCFKRDVVESIGYFDEDYGRGPCHEIDFSTRAYKAGYKGVWVRGAYVHRFPRVSSVIRREQASFQMAKKKYQSRFCGLNLGLVGDCPCSFGHCLGEDCEHFAPQGLTNVFVGMKPSKLSSNADISLVSCIMPTKNTPGLYPKR